jgi:Flp pilus assembly protein TadB
MSRRSAIRASDDERDQIAERLREAAAEGRLLAEELEHRLAHALRAQTLGELDQLVADLPRQRPSGRRLAPRSPLMMLAMATAVAFVAVVALVLVAMVLTGAVFAWLLWMLVAWRLFGHGPRWRCHRSRYHAQMRYAGRRPLL